MILPLPAPIPPPPPEIINPEVMERIIADPGRDWNLLMGCTAPPPPRFPPPPARPLDMEREADRQAYFAYEAEREFKTWNTGEVYTPLPPEGLVFYDGRVLTQPFRPPIPAPIPPRALLGSRPAAPTPKDPPPIVG